MVTSRANPTPIEEMQPERLFYMPSRSIIIDTTPAPLPTSSTTTGDVSQAVTISSPVPEPAKDQPLQLLASSSSPEPAHDESPRTPSKSQQGLSQEATSVLPSSEYYTSAWGSPYELSPSRDLPSVDITVSADLQGDDYLSSPDAPFGLEHLIPSRFPDSALADTEQFDQGPELADPEALDQTPRPTAERWVPLPKREAPEKPQWWSASSSEAEQEKSPHKGLASEGQRRVRRHKKRPENKTLDQQAYLDLVREREVGEMSGLKASRWASTPVQEEEKQLENVESQVAVAEQETEKGPEISITTGQEEATDISIPEQVEVDLRDTKTNDELTNEDETVQIASTVPPSAVDEGVRKPDQSDAPLQNMSWAEDVEDSIAIPETSQIQEAGQASGKSTLVAAETNTAGLDNTVPTLEIPEGNGDAHINTSQPDMTTADTQPAAAPFRLEPPRLKKRVSWRGKNCQINIPNLDFVALGLHFPMTVEEARERIATLDSTSNNAIDSTTEAHEHVAAHVRPIFPDEQESRHWQRGRKAVVSLPNRNALMDAQQAIIEAKLAALGVSPNDGALSPQPDEMSRQTSSTFPQVFSPPIPPSSANSMRPPFVRGHSHTTSFAIPNVPGNGPFGHMHRHSTFHGFSPLQTQDLMRPTGLSGPPGFSPASPFNMPSGIQIASPAQMNLLRNELGNVRGPGTPLSQSMTPEPVDMQRQRLQGLMQQPPLPPSQWPFRGPAESTAELPRLPEDDGEDELSDPVPYLPPHKRATLNEDIIVPTPRHRHNISEGLEREVMQIEEQREIDAMQSNGRVNSFGQAPKLFGQVSDQVPAERDPLGGELAVSESGRNHKRTGSRFNVSTAPTFTFNPAANFKPGSSSFTFGGPAAKRAGDSSHTRQVSSGTLNITAPEFKPSASVDGPAPPTSAFNFLASGPSYNAGMTFKASAAPPTTTGPNIVDELPSIFGKINIPDIIKPTRKSTAVAIVRPSESASRSASATDAEDEDGRLIRSDDRQKRSRHRDGNSGDEVPQFAVPTTAQPVLSAEPVLTSQPANLSPIKEISSPEVVRARVVEMHRDGTQESRVSSPVEKDSEPASPRHIGAQHKANNSSLSALAQPWMPSSSLQAADKDASGSVTAGSELEDGELRSDEDVNEPDGKREANLDALREPPAAATAIYPSFDEIDAVMQQLNADNEAKPADDIANAFAPQEGVQYLSSWPRSDAPSPSPKRRQAQLPSPPTQLSKKSLNGDIWSEVNRLNKAPGPPSDWSDMVTPADDDKLQARSSFFDSRIDDVVGRVLADRLRPFEDALQSIQLSLRKATPVDRRTSKHRSSSAMESDADDEDDSDRPRQRPISRGRDDKLGHIKAIVLEALREQSPQRSQSAYDIADLHGALADMKMSFARAASSSLELDDIRAIVEDAVARQPYSGEIEGTQNKRQMSELEGKLNETLTNALEQANRMHEVEQREAEARRSLKLAEEEIRLLREDNDDGSTRSRAFESERGTLLDRVNESEEARTRAEAHGDSLRAEVEALQETLEEYRTSSKQWRQRAEEHKLERESLQGTVQALEKQLQDKHESSSGVKRRLERLQSDMAMASGQLASEKNRWKTREETYRAQCESLEAQVSTNTREKLQLEQEVRRLHEQTAELDAAKQAFSGLHTANASLDEMARGLRGELQAAQALASQFERDFKETREAGRLELQRVRLALELDVETANHRASLLRHELEGELAHVRADLDNVRLAADAAKEKHVHMLNEAAETRDAHLQHVQKTSSVAIDESRHKYENAVKDLTQQHNRSLAYAIEDKERSEYLLNERLSLADAKLQHFQDRITYLEERLDIAKSAAQAAAMSAKGSKSQATAAAAPATAYRNIGLPEKVSPQALRESILVLQEQLQDREFRIEKLQQTLKTDGPAKVKERDTEIAWLRELLTVRGEELKDLVDALSQPTFDRDAVRDTAIRIQANLQMEQQEKERTGLQMTAGQAIASLSSFATPKAAQLTSAFNKWRAGMESSALKSRSSSRVGNRSSTPSRAPSAAKGRYDPSGLMTPPTSNLRSSPSPEATSTVPAPKLSARQQPKVEEEDRPPHEHTQTQEPPSTPNLFGSGHYDDDAEDRVGDISALDDDDLDVADSEPPAFKSLEAELMQPVEAGAEQ